MDKQALQEAVRVTNRMAEPLHDTPYQPPREEPVTREPSIHKHAYAINEWKSRTVCNLVIDCTFATLLDEKVTCRNCLRILAKAREN